MDNTTPTPLTSAIPAPAATADELAALVADLTPPTPAPAAISPPTQGSTSPAGPVYAPALPGAAPPSWFDNPLTMRYLAVLMLGAVFVFHSGCDWVGQTTLALGALAVPTGHLVKTLLGVQGQ